jgi:hypothetical protein
VQQSVVAYDETEAPRLKNSLQMLYLIYQRLATYIFPWLLCADVWHAFGKLCYLVDFPVMKCDPPVWDLII